MPFKPIEVKSWMDNGVMFALSILVIWALALGVFVLFKWAMKRLQSTPSSPCDGCAFVGDVRDPKDLIQHRLFSFIRLARAFMIPNLPILDPGRKAVFEDLQDIKFRVVSERFSDWLKRNLPNLEDDLAPDLLASEMLSLVASIVEDYEEESRRSGIPTVVLDRFRSWHGSRIAHLRSEIGLVCESEWITDSTQRMGFILSVVEQVMKATVLDAERTLFSLNGQLTGLHYKGLVIGPCPPRRESSASVSPVREEDSTAGLRSKK